MSPDRNQRRLFIGLPLCSMKDSGIMNIHAKLGRYQSGLNIVPAENFHITLKFLGGMPADKADEISAAFSQIDFTGGTITAEVTGLGAFPSDDSPSVIYYSLSTDYPRIAGLLSGTEKFSARFGFDIETRKFIPHLTAARVRRGTGVQAELVSLISGTKNKLLATFEMTRIVLYESILSGRGAVYSELAAVELD